VNPVGGYKRAGHDIKCVRAALKRVERGRYILGSPDFEWRDFDAEPASRGLNLSHLGG
jgi:hypothetical protein